MNAPLSRNLEALLTDKIMNPEDRQRVIRKITDIVQYRSTIAVFGKTGVG